MSALDKLNTRTLMNNGRTVIRATNDKGGVHKVQILATENELIDDVPVLQLYGLAGHAPVGTEAHILCTRSDRSSAVVIATNHVAARPRDQKAGEVTLFTDEGDAIALRRDHVVVIVTQTLNITASTINIVAPGGGNTTVNVTGDIHATGTITADTINAPHGHVGP